jgi:hypothetical protein
MEANRIGLKSGFSVQNVEEVSKKVSSNHKPLRTQQKSSNNIPQSTTHEVKSEQPSTTMKIVEEKQPSHPVATKNSVEAITSATTINEIANEQSIQQPTTNTVQTQRIPSVNINPFSMGPIGKKLRADNSKSKMTSDNTSKSTPSGKVLSPEERKQDPSVSTSISNHNNSPQIPNVRLNAPKPFNLNGRKGPIHQSRKEVIKTPHPTFAKVTVVNRVHHRKTDPKSSTNNAPIENSTVLSKSNDVQKSPVFTETESPVLSTSDKDHLVVFASRDNDNKT